MEVPAAFYRGLLHALPPSLLFWAAVGVAVELA
jgi:hypothetical protein